MEIVKKIGPSLFSEFAAPMDALLAGKVDEYETGGQDSDKGIWFRFRGLFECQFINSEGARNSVQSSQLFLPDIAARPLKAACDDAEKMPLQFAIKLSKKKVSEKQSPVGWEWTYSSLLAPQNEKTLLESIIGDGLDELLKLPPKQAEPEKKIAKK